MVICGRDRPPKTQTSASSPVNEQVFASTMTCSSPSPDSQQNQNGEICRICHCEAEIDAPLISPCLCSGSLRYVHQACLQQWIKSADTRTCELCKFQFIMRTEIKPLRKWEKLDMSPVERRKIFCSVLFHAVALSCVIWSLYVLLERTAAELRAGNLEWPLWTKLLVVGVGCTGAVLFMYTQCKLYIQLCRRWRAFNRVIYVQNAPLQLKKSARALTTAQRESTNGASPQTNSSSGTIADAANSASVDGAEKNSTPADVKDAIACGFSIDEEFKKDNIVAVATAPPQSPESGGAGAQDSTVDSTSGVGCASASAALSLVVGILGKNRSHCNCPEDTRVVTEINTSTVILPIPEVNVHVESSHNVPADEAMCGQCRRGSAQAGSLPTPKQTGLPGVVGNGPETSAPTADFCPGAARNQSRAPDTCFVPGGDTVLLQYPVPMESADHPDPMVSSTVVTVIPVDVWALQFPVAPVPVMVHSQSLPANTSHCSTLPDDSPTVGWLST